MNFDRLKTFVVLLIVAQGFAAKSQITFAWNPPVSTAPITNYTVYWGTASGFYVFEAYAGTQTNLTVTGLASNTVYYFTVTATDQNGMESPNSGEVVCTNAPLIMPPPPGGQAETSRQEPTEAGQRTVPAPAVAVRAARAEPAAGAVPWAKFPFQGFLQF